MERKARKKCIIKLFQQRKGKKMVNGECDSYVSIELRRLYSREENSITAQG